MRLSIIVAMDNNRLIGKNNALPWHLPADLAYFKKTTIKKTVLMGRKTYDSIGKPLPNRRNIILSRAPKSPKGCETFSSIRLALDTCKNEKEVFVIGGVSIYKQFINSHINKSSLSAYEIAPLVSRLYITQIKGEFEGDAYFPEFNQESFVEISSQSFSSDEKNPHAYSFIVLERVT